MSLTALYPELTAPLALTTGDTADPAADFEVLGLALNAAGLTSTVASLNDITVFAPSDQAFADLAVDFGFSGDTSDATAVFNSIAGSLATLDPDGDPIPLLTDILTYHIAPGAETLSDLNTEGPQATLLEGETFEVTGGSIVDGNPDAVNADIVSADVTTTAGTVQVVDKVLLPIDTPVESGQGTLLDLLKESGGSADTDGSDYDLLLSAVQATGLDGSLDDPTSDLTVFLPNDQAFITFARDLGYEGDDEAGALNTILQASADADPENPLDLVQNIIEYHVSPGEQNAAAVLNSTDLATLEGPTIGVDGTTLVDQDADNAIANITGTDIDATNGIAHSIDQVLLPNEIPVVDNVFPDEESSDDDDDDGGLSGLELIFGAFLVFFALG